MLQEQEKHQPQMQTQLGLAKPPIPRSCGGRREWKAEAKAGLVAPAADLARRFGQFFDESEEIVPAVGPAWAPWGADLCRL